MGEKSQICNRRWIDTTRNLLARNSHFVHKAIMPPYLASWPNSPKESCWLWWIVLLKWGWFRYWLNPWLVMCQQILSTSPELSSTKFVLKLCQKPVSVLVLCKNNWMRDKLCIPLFYRRPLQLEKNRALFQCQSWFLDWYGQLYILQSPPYYRR